MPKRKRWQVHFNDMFLPLYSLSTSICLFSYFQFKLNCLRCVSADVQIGTWNTCAHQPTSKERAVKYNITVKVHVGVRNSTMIERQVCVVTCVLLYWIVYSIPNTWLGLGLCLWLWLLYTSATLRWRVCSNGCAWDGSDDVDNCCTDVWTDDDWWEWPVSSACGQRV